MKIGDKIKESRKKAGLTQKELAERVNVTTRCIQYYEGNIRKPQTTEIIIKLAAALNVEVNYFLSERELEIMRENEMFLGEAESKYGKSGKAQAKQIIENAQAFFRAITELYFDSKKNNGRK